MKQNRLSVDKAIILVCDIQEKFAPKAYKPQAIIEASAMMVRTAALLGVPILTTQHYKKAFGQTCQEIKKYIPEGSPFIEKRKFSMIIPQVEAYLQKNKQRKQVLLCGMETHVCVLQTCLDLLGKQYQVYILVDAVTSLRSWQRSIALRRMEKEGATITTFQSASFQLLNTSQHDKFKDFQKILKDYSRDNAISHL